MIQVLARGAELPTVARLRMMSDRGARRASDRRGSLLLGVLEDDGGCDELGCGCDVGCGSRTTNFTIVRTNAGIFGVQRQK
jgi:hypothetical protein